MATFTDANGREWRVPVEWGSVRRLRDSALKIDLMKVIADDGSLLEKLSNDPILLIDVLYVLCKPQCDGLQLTDEQFGEALIGDALDKAAAALLDGLCDFFPGPKRRAMKKAAEKFAKLLDARTDNVTTMIDSPEFDRRLEALLDAQSDAAREKALRNLLTKSSTSSPDEPEA